MLKSSSFFAVLLFATLGLSASAQAGCKVETKTDDFSGEEMRVAAFQNIATITQTGDEILLKSRLFAISLIQSTIPPESEIILKLEDGSVIELGLDTAILPRFLGSYTYWDYESPISQAQMDQLATSKISIAKTDLVDGERRFDPSHVSAKAIMKVAKCFASDK